MKLLMATCADDIVMEYAQFTLPILKHYADKWDAEFKILEDKSYNEMGKAMWNFRTMVFYDYFKTYDRILYVDSDIIVNRTCPNLFDIVPYDNIGLVMEDKGSRLKDRRKRIELIKEVFGGNEHWKEGFLNGGFYIVSKVHRDIFTKINGELWNGPGYDGNHYCYNIMKYNFKYIDLGYKYNHMAMFSEPWNGSPSRFDSYLLHYAGGAKFPDKGERTRVELIKDDIRKIYGNEDFGII